MSKEIIRKDLFTEEQLSSMYKLMDEIFALTMRVNMETPMACFLDVSGHVDNIQIKITESKDRYHAKLTSHNIYYYKEYEEDHGYASFVALAEIAIEDLTNILNSNWDKIYKAYCNLVDMSCHQTFTSEEAAKAWVKKMKRKYNKVHAIVGYDVETVEV